MPPGSREEEEADFDAYLDLLLRGEEVEPDAFLAARGHAGEDGSLPAWLQDVWHVARGESSARTGGEPDEVEAGLPFERVGSFKLLRLLGEGGMGRVFLARQEPLGRLCAVKLLRADQSSSPTARARLEREARVLAGLRHDHVLRVLDAGHSEGAPWIALELVPGRNLDELVQEGRPSVEDIVRWGAELADGLEHAHAAGVIHRDVKPGNVRVTPDGRALLLDFGLARDTTRETAKLTHAFMGTPAYVAPEQIRGADVDARCDVYGLGATLFEALAGEPAFRGAEVEQVLHDVLNEPAPTLASRGVRVSPDLELVLATALAKSPERRYANASALRDDLRAVLELRPISARPPRALTRTLDWTRRHRAVSAVLVAVVATVVVLALWDAKRRADVRRADHVEAAGLVERARDLVERYDADRAAFERASFDLRGLRTERQNRHVSEDELRRLGDARRLVADYEELRLDMDDVPVLLGRAERLHASADGIDGVRAAYWYQRWLDVRDHEDRSAPERFAESVIEADPDGTWTEKVSGRVALRIESEPPGAEVFLYRVARHREPAGERYVPLPIGAPPITARPDPGALALEVLVATPPLELGDWLLSIDGSPIEARSRPVAGDVVERLRNGSLEEVVLEGTPEVRASGAPLLPLDAARIGRTPLEFPASDPGFYAALILHDGFEPQRISFHLDHACEHYSRGLTLHAALLERGTTPAGFVHVPVAAYGNGERSFWMQRYEVTAAQYLEFLRSKTGRAAVAEGRVPWPRTTAAKPWPDDGGIAELPRGTDPNAPMLGVTVDAARAYAAWLAERLPGCATGRYELGLPTLLEWRWAAYGGDARAYVHGPEFVPTWVSSRFAGPEPAPAPVGAFVLDESPYAVHDLAGSAAEWTWDGASSAWALCGGAWNLASAQDFAIARARYPAPDAFEAGTGFRLVLREAER